MFYRYSTALSHIFLAGTGLYCLFNTGVLQMNFPRVIFGIIFINSVFGIWRWGNPSFGGKVDGLYRFTSYLQLLFAVPCVTTTVWLASGYDIYLSWTWALIPIIPLFLYLLTSSNEQLEEIIISITLVSLSVVSFLAENYWGITTVLSYAINHYIVLKQRTDFDVPAQDLYNYGLCFFAYFALRAIL